jgi:hypothetical protein
MTAYFLLPPPPHALWEGFWWSKSDTKWEVLQNSLDCHTDQWLHRRSHCLGSPPHLIWLDLILIAPIGLHAVFTLSSPSVPFLRRFLLLLYCAIIVYSALLFNWFYYCLNILITVFLILELYSRYFDPVNNNFIASFLIYLKTFGYFDLSIGLLKAYYHKSWNRIYGTNFSDWGEEGKTLSMT